MNQSDGTPSLAEKTEFLITHYSRPEWNRTEICDEVARRLARISGEPQSWGAKYLMQVAKGHPVAGKALAASIDKLYRQINKSRKPRKPGPKRVMVTFPDSREAEVAARLSMERRQRAFRWERLVGEELPGFLARRGKYRNNY